MARNYRHQNLIYNPRPCPTDIVETTTHVIVTVDLQGIMVDQDLKLQVQNQTLTFTIKHNGQQFPQNICLPKYLEVNGAHATYKRHNGKLIVEIPRYQPIVEIPRYQPIVEIPRYQPVSYRPYAYEVAPY